jgi:hypothetical protein
VDGQPSPAARVDIGKGAVRKSRPFAGAEPRHAKTIAGPRAGERRYG